MPKEADVMKGAPSDGDEYHEEDEGENEGQNAADKRKEADKGEEGEDPKVTIARLQGELAVLRARPASPEPEKKAPEPEKERDWEKLIFEDTPNAIKLLKEDIRKEITGELRGAYQKDMGEKEFWGEFYAANEDLKEDKDLVQATLASHMRALADLPVSEASKRLGDLTRARILRYKGGEVEKKNDKKAKAEGSGAPSSKKADPEQPKILSLGDVIRARRAARHKKAVTA